MDMDVDQVVDYENGDMEEQDQVAFFQEMVNSGMAWRLQGSYGRTAMDMIEAGLITLGEVGHRDYYGNYVPSKYEVEPGTKGSQEYVDDAEKRRS